MDNFLALLSSFISNVICEIPCNFLCLDKKMLTWFLSIKLNNLKIYNNIYAYYMQQSKPY